MDYAMAQKQAQQQLGQYINWPVAQPLIAPLTADDLSWGQQTAAQLFPSITGTISAAKTETKVYSQEYVDWLNKQIADLHIELSETRRMVIEIEDDRDEIAQWYSRLLIAISKDQDAKAAADSEPPSPVFAAIGRTLSANLRSQVQPNISMISRTDD